MGVRLICVEPKLVPESDRKICESTLRYALVEVYNKLPANYQVKVKYYG